MQTKLIIVGGVAGGASAAARARRLDDTAEIIVFERGPYVSFANCGLPYFIGGEITDRKKLVVQTPESLKSRLNLDVRTNTEVTEIDRKRLLIRFRHVLTGEEGEMNYTHLLLATGATPLRPPIPGLDQEGIFTLRTIPDMDRIDRWIKERQPKRAVVVGAGFIGLEMVEQLQRRQLEVVLVEALPQVLGPIDPELAGLLERELVAHGIEIRLGHAVEAFELPAPGRAAPTVKLKDGSLLPCDLVLFGIGVRPDATLAKVAGLALGERGGVRVDLHLQTTDPHIWAVGDCIEIPNRVSGELGPVPLAGPSNRQGRIAADNIFGRKVSYEGSFGTAIVRVFGLSAALTGLNEAQARRQSIKFRSVSLHPNAHAGYYPEAHPIALKVLFSPVSGKLLGAQAVGQDGVDKRIDILATALYSGLSIEELIDLELCYSPPFGSAKDAVNVAGMIGENVMTGLVHTITWDELLKMLPSGELLVLDVRSEKERALGSIPGSVNIPIDELRSRLAELSPMQEIVVYCATGERSYYACRILMQHGFRCKNLSGAYKTWSSARVEIVKIP